MQSSGGGQIAGHRLADILGQGGMGTVYAAHHPRLPRMVALKVLNAPVSADPTFRLRFQREGQLAAGLEHPHIVPIYDCGEDNGHLWLSMRLVRGTTAGALIARAPQGMDIPVAMEILTDIARALDFGHRRGVVHRDVKPANILIDTEVDQILLGDFGIARQIGADDELTAAGTFIGTFDYCSPEQLSDDDLDGRADQYSLACMAAHLLTGCKPFRGPTAATVMKQHLADPPPSISAMRPGLPVGVDAVIARGMAKRRDDRYPTCTEFVAELSAVLGPATGTLIEPTAQHEISAQNADTVVAHRAPATLQPPTPTPDHYDFVGEAQEFTYSVDGRSHTVRLRRIRARRDLPQHRVAASDIGGWLESQANLADQAWVGEEAWVVGDARVRENAAVRENAFIGDRAEVAGTARVDGDSSVFGDAHVAGNTRVSGMAEIKDSATVSGSAWVYEEAVLADSARATDNARICGGSRVAGRAQITDYAIVSEHATITDDAHVSGHARVSGSASVSGRARVEERARVLGTAEIGGSVTVADEQVVG
ncbi:protein kinase [Gordonia desulfuricans]|uniref:non-specific serine/threonine protein kinase n=1 Tax=Gordonia desulfuricans TaxID=89051 RepID=A0A7K3LSR0_9ACTN|nr:protein kinase [Gordonia desulfuricans]NDK91324.1 protein kinase [Gordonia desulfuricans]